MTAPVYYLSGPISDPDPAQVERNKQAFTDAAALLRANGLEVVNPVEVCPEVGMSWSWYMRRCIKAMMDCDEVVLLPRWFDSKGACVECALGGDLGMRVRMLDRFLSDLGITERAK